MLAIIGGTGLYELPGMTVETAIGDETPFGAPSGQVLRGRIGEQPLLFLARHGAGHKLLPHEVNYRANVYALKREGATMLLGFSAVGSLAERVAPGQLAMPSQYLDLTKGRRAHTFFGEGVAAHVSTACPVSAAMVDWVGDAAATLGLTLHRDLTYACVEGPRLGTRAESFFMRAAGCQLVGMTNVPEVFLAREAQLGYATIGLVTHYDCWMDDPQHHVSVATVFERYAHTLGQAQALLARLLTLPLPSIESSTRQALASALITKPEGLPDGQR
ncbi:MAG TPA: MTAP family purine nucleoside phosphorylase, partial [Rubrivivax sp.]|nr:MTAP family purine nucleoside phosphorylase [Rubrivivax sp.]